MNNFSEPKITIDLKEYILLKESHEKILEYDGKSPVEDISTEELSDAIGIIYRGVVKGYSHDEIGHQILRELSIAMEITDNPVKGHPIVRLKKRK